MTKKAITLPINTLIGIVLAGLIIFGTYNIVSGFFRLSDEAVQSYDELLRTIESIRDSTEGRIESLPLHMDERTAIVFFPKESKEVMIVARIETDTLFTKVQKPADCGEEKFCVCLCRDFEQIKTVGAGETSACKNSKCKSYDTILYAIPTNKCKSNDNRLFCISSVNDGSAIQRALFSPLANKDKRTNAIYVEKGKNSVAVCPVEQFSDDDSCFTELRAELGTKCSKYDSQDSCRADNDCAWSGTETQGSCEPKNI